jgi:opacity protein-like surface antigen
MYKSLFCTRFSPLAATSMALFMLSAVLSATPVLAHEEDDDDYEPPVNEFEITPFAGFAVGGEFEDPSDGSGRQLNADAYFGVLLDFTTEDPSRHYELLYSNQMTDVEGTISTSTSKLDLEVQYLHIGGVIDFGSPNRRAIPFVAGGLGATLLSPDRNGLNDETEFSLSVAGGVKIPLSEHVALRFDARAFVTFLDSDSSVFCVSSPPTATCDIRAKSDSFVQFSAGIGVTAGF